MMFWSKKCIIIIIIITGLHSGGIYYSEAIYYTVSVCAHVD